MTDKHIIDGVDVAECRYFTSEWDFNNCGHICKGTECEYKRLWYKKQLKRKERECEQLKNLSNHNGRVCNERLDEIDKLEHNINELNKQLDKSEAENKKLKKMLRKLISEVK